MQVISAFSRWAFQILEEILRLEAEVLRVVLVCGRKQPLRMRKAIEKLSVVMDILTYCNLRQK